MQNKVLVVIDIQNDITKNYKEIIHNINAAIDWAVRNEIHVVYIKHNNLSAGTRTFKPDTRGAELVADLKIASQKKKEKSLFLEGIYRRGLFDGRLDECACEFEWYMIYKYFIDPVKFILSAKALGWKEEVQYLRRELLKFFPEAYYNAYLVGNPKWKEYAELLRQG